MNELQKKLFKDTPLSMNNSPIEDYDAMLEAQQVDDEMSKEFRLKDPSFGTGEMLMRPNDASEDFMKYLQNPTSKMIPSSPAGNPSAIEDFDAMVEQDSLDKSLKASVSAPQNIATSSKIGMSGSSKSGSIPPITPPASIPQEDILSQLKAARDANAASLAGARQSDKMTELGNLIMKSGSMAGEGIVNQSGNTKINLDAAQSVADESKFAGEGAKSKLEALMQDYGIKKGIDDTKYSRDKDAQARKDRLLERSQDLALKREELDYKKKNDASAKIQAKEEVKEDIQIKKENRKMRKELDAAVPMLETQLQNIKEAKELLKKTSTGPVDQYTSKLTDSGQKLEQKLNKISLDTMVKMFSGMSKAVDTNAERAQFQSTQPSMGNYENVNRDTLDSLEKSVKSLIDKTNKSKQLYDRTGDFTQPEEKTPQQNNAVNNSQDSGEVERKTKDGRIGVFDAATKTFLRYK
jgi:hypothetical protein